MLPRPSRKLPMIGRSAAAHVVALSSISAKALQDVENPRESGEGPAEVAARKLVAAL